MWKSDGFVWYGEQVGDSTKHFTAICLDATMDAAMVCSREATCKVRCGSPLVQTVRTSSTRLHTQCCSPMTARSRACGRVNLRMAKCYRRSGCRPWRARHPRCRGRPRSPPLRRGSLRRGRASSM
ncbi:hypothetical protein T492DRAFT_202240 [Pavlovales sp. CCMP2436]|nr:hypothetical protein T492DRAFT_202240 [Pavlovales sp. CCMP2436]